MSLPKGPTAPAPFQMFHWITKPMAYLERCSQEYGDVFTVPLGYNFTPVVFLNHPEDMQQMFTGKEFEASGELNDVFEPFAGQHSIIRVSGKQHQQRRKLMIPPFHGDRIRIYGEIISRATQETIHQWPHDQPILVRDSMQKISLTVILKVVFGLVNGPRYQQLEHLLSSMMEGMTSPLTSGALYLPFLRLDLGPWSPWGKFIRQKQQADDLIYAEIAERRQHPDLSRTDILSLLMAARDEAGQPMTDVELHDELLNLLFAGHENTSTALTWAIYWLHKYPTIRQKLLTELAGIDISANSDALLEKLPYLRAFCYETLRIYPNGILTFPRIVTEPVTVRGHQIEIGTVVVGCIYLTHQRPDIYPDPHRFDLNRFLDHQVSPYEFVTFGGGSRHCLGMALSLFEMKVAITQVLSNLELSLVNESSVKAIRRGPNIAPSEYYVTARPYQRDSNQKRQVTKSLPAA